MVIAGLAYLAIGTLQDSSVLAVIGAVSVGLGIGFLPYNFPTARVFLGDSGSYFCGGILGLAAIIATNSGAGLLAALTPIGLYGFDTAYTLLRRTLRGEKVGAPHREHIYQRMAQRKGHAWSALFTSVVAAVVCAIGIASIVVPFSLVLGASTLLVLACYAAVPEWFLRKVGSI